MIILHFKCNFEAKLPPVQIYVCVNICVYILYIQYIYIHVHTVYVELRWWFKIYAQHFTSQLLTFIKFALHLFLNYKTEMF